MDTTPQAAPSSASGGAPESPPSPAPEPETGATARAEAPRARGRPRGSTDKRPRVRKSKSSGGSAPSGGSKPKSTNPLQDPVAGDAPGAAGKVGPQAMSPDQVALQTMKPEELAEMAVGIGQAILLQIAALRYGIDDTVEMLSLTEDEKTNLEKCTASYMKTSVVQMTPGEALLLAIAVTYGLKVPKLEARRAQRKNAANLQVVQPSAAAA